MENICRSCLKVGSQMKNLFGDEGGHLIVMIKECISIKVTATDGLPDSLCSECEEKLQSAFDFRELFKNNDQALRSHLNVALKDDVDDDCETNNFDQEIQNSELDAGETEDEDIKPAKYKCSQCSKSFTSPRALGAHRQKTHGGEDDDPDFDAEAFISRNKIYNCTHCDMTFARQHLLMKHQKEVHLEVSLQENIKTEIQDFEDEDDDEDEEDEEYVDDEIEDLMETESDKGVEGKKEFACEFCNKVLKTKQGLNVHLRRHTGKNLYHCRICSKSFIKLSHIKRHGTKAHGIDVSQEEYLRPSQKKRVMQCEFCDRKFKYKKSFTQHMRVEHGIDVDEEELQVEPVSKRRKKSTNEKSAGEDEEMDEEAETEAAENGKRAYACHVCNAEFTRPHYLSRHMVIHRELMTHMCDKCDEAFTSDELLQKHMAQHVDKPYNCFACPKTFVRAEHYIRHIKTHEIDEDKTLQCPICPEQHVGIDSLSVHIKAHLNKEKRHVCNECGKTFIRADNLRTHMKVHTEGKEVPKLHLCVYCGKEFNNSSNMIVHMRRHTGERPYKCKQCGKGFPRSHDLKCHERTHSGEKPYLCTLCGKSFNKSNKLLRHTRVHTGERPYVCSICGRAFTQSNDLALHMRRHTGARPYACGVCPARFIQSGQLKAHQRSKGHWAETTPDLKGSYRVEPVISTGESKPIRFRRNAAGEIYQPPDFISKGSPAHQEPQVTKETTEVPATVSTVEATNIHLVQTQPKVMLLPTYEPFTQTYTDGTTVVKVQTDAIQVVHALTPNSTNTTFQEDSQGTENTSTFSTNEGAFECRSFS